MHSIGVAILISSLLGVASAFTADRSSISYGSTPATNTKVVTITPSLTSAFGLQRQSNNPGKNLAFVLQQKSILKIQQQRHSCTTALFSSTKTDSGNDSPAVASPVRIIIAGAPASGKGTQCELIKKQYNVVHLSTGDMLREAVSAGTKIGLMAKDYMDNGMLVPDDVIIGVVSVACLYLLMSFK